MRQLSFWLLVSGLLLQCGFLSAADYRIGVLAKNGPTKAFARWNATAEYLSEKISGHKFVIKPLGFDEVYPAVEAGEVDFLLVNSSMFVTTQLAYGTRPLVTMINIRRGQALNVFAGVIFTHITRDDINSLNDLKGKRFAAVSKSSFGGWQMAAQVLDQHGIDRNKDLAELHFAGKHDNVVYTVQNGEVDAGTVRSDTLERLEAKGFINLQEFKIINAQAHDGFPFVHSTPVYPEWPFARLAHIPNELSNSVASHLKAIEPTMAAAKHAKIQGWAAPLDYGAVENLQRVLGVGGYAQRWSEDDLKGGSK